MTAHAYLFYPDRRELSEEARHRLSTLADYTELGSGYRIAMRDLELRGAGNLLGDEQSGHVAAIGFELYCELLAEAVAELQGAAGPRPRPVRRRRPGRRLRARRLRAAGGGQDRPAPAAGAGRLTVTELRELQAELADRFGPLPVPVANLLGDSGGAAAGRPSWAPRSVALRGGRLTVSPVQLGGAEVRELKSQVPGALYTVATREVSCRLEPPAPGEKPHMRGAWTSSLLYSKRAASSRRNVCYASFSHRSHTYVPGRGRSRVRRRQL